MSSSAPAIPAFRLHGAVEIPAMGVGTYVKHPEEAAAVRPAVIAALELGYRHIDTASKYGTEASVGDAVAEAVLRGVVSSREEVFLTSKLWCTQCHPHLVIPSIKESLKNLQMDYLDLYLIHWPLSVKPGPLSNSMKREDVVPMDLKGVWEAMEECQRLGFAKAIGVSNFNIKKLEELLAFAKIPPAVNQIEMNPVCQQNKLRQFCADKGIHVTAYSPLGGQGKQNQVMDCEELKSIAEATGKTASQISLRWIYEQGASVVVKTFKKERLVDNLGIFTWELRDEDYTKMIKIPQRKRTSTASILLQQGTFSVDVSEIDVVDF